MPVGVMQRPAGGNHMKINSLAGRWGNICRQPWRNLYGRFRAGGLFDPSRQAERAFHRRWRCRYRSLHRRRGIQGRSGRSVVVENLPAASGIRGQEQPRHSTADHRCRCCRLRRCADELGCRAKVLVAEWGVGWHLHRNKTHTCGLLALVACARDLHESSVET